MTIKVTDKKGTILTKEEEIMERWREHFEELLEQCNTHNNDDLHYEADRHTQEEYIGGGIV